MKREEVRARIQEVGLIPAARVSAAEEARFAAEALSGGGIPIVEIPMTVPDAIGVISHLARQLPEMIVGAGSLLDTQTARLCLDAGASFLNRLGELSSDFTPVPPVMFRSTMVPLMGARTGTTGEG